MSRHAFTTETSRAANERRARSKAAAAISAFAMSRFPADSVEQETLLRASARMLTYRMQDDPHLPTHSLEVASWNS